MKCMFELKLRKRFIEKCWWENKIIMWWIFYGFWCRNLVCCWNYGNYLFNIDIFYWYGIVELKVSDEGIVMNLSIINFFDCIVLIVMVSGILIMKMMIFCKKLMIL